MNVAAPHVVSDFRPWAATLDGTNRLQNMIGGNGCAVREEGITGGRYDESIVYYGDWRPEDDMTYTRKDIGRMVKEGVARELGAETTKKEIRGLARQAGADELRAFSKDPG